MANGTAGAREAALYVLARCRRFDAWSQQTIQAAAEKYSKYLEAFSSPVCSVDLFLSGAESSRGRLVFYSGSAAFPTKRGEARFENPRLFLRYDGGKISDGLSVGIRAEKFSCGALPQCGNISASANLLAGGGAFALSNIYVSAGNMEYEGFKLDNVSMRKDFFDMDSAGEGWEAFAAFGDWMFCTNENTDNVTVFHLENGVPVQTPTELHMPHPLCVIGVLREK